MADRFTELFPDWMFKGRTGTDPITRQLREFHDLIIPKYWGVWTADQSAPDQMFQSISPMYFWQPSQGSASDLRGIDSEGFFLFQGLVPPHPRLPKLPRHSGRRFEKVYPTSGPNHFAGQKFVYVEILGEDTQETQLRRTQGLFEGVYYARGMQKFGPMGQFEIAPYQDSPTTRAAILEMHRRICPK